MKTTTKRLRRRRGEILSRHYKINLKIDLVDHENEVEGEHIDKDGRGAAQVLHETPQPTNHCR